MDDQTAARAVRVLRAIVEERKRLLAAAVVEPNGVFTEQTLAAMMEDRHRFEDETGSLIEVLAVLR